jgi:hypothetical protein
VTGLPPPTPFVAGLEAVVVAAFLLVLGYLVADGVVGGRDVDRVVRWALAFPGLLAFALVLMLAHIATGGAVLSNAWLTRGLTLGVGLALAALRLLRRRRSPAVPGASRADWLALLAVVGLGIAAWCTPVFRMLPMDSMGDMSLHMGWATQLMNGESTPSGAMTGDIPNYYPWLYHALVVLTARFTPGGRAYHALGPLQLMTVPATLAALFALGRALAGRWATGAAVALLGGLTGGFGYWSFHGPGLVTGPRTGAAMKFYGDLFFKRSYNFAFGNLGPAFPRDVTYALLPVVLLLLLLAMRRRGMAELVGAGLVLGMIALTGAEVFFSGTVVAVLVAATWPGRLRTRLRAAAAVLGPALALWLLWLGPLIWNAVKLGGFVTLGSQPVSLPPLGVLGAWGMITPLALWGGPVVLRRLRGRDVGARLTLLFLLAAGALVVGSVVAATFLPQAVVTLGRPHRYWPILCLAVALVGAQGLVDLVERARRVRRPLAIAAAALVVALAIPSPFLGSIRLPARLSSDGWLRRSLRGDETTILGRLLAHPGAGTVVAAVPLHIDHDLFSYTGFRMVEYRWNHSEYGHVRWQRYTDEVALDPQRIRDNRRLVSGRGGPAEWQALTRRYGVDAVVVRTSHLHWKTFRDCGARPDPIKPSVALVWVASCPPA